MQYCLALTVGKASVGAQVHQSQRLSQTLRKWSFRFRLRSRLLLLRRDIQTKVGFALFTITPQLTSRILDHLHIFL